MARVLSARISYRAQRIDTFMLFIICGATHVGHNGAGVDSQFVTPSPIVVLQSRSLGGAQLSVINEIVP
jgi:hypothetical protein